MTSVPPTQPPAAPETDVNAWAERFLVQCGPCDGGLPMGCACPNEDPRPVIAALAERVRVVEGERDAALDRYADREQRWHWSLIREGNAIREAAEAIARAESAEAAHAAEKAAHEQLRAGLEALARNLAARAEEKHDLASETDYDVDIARFNGEGTGLGIARMLAADLRAGGGAR